MNKAALEKQSLQDQGAGEVSLIWGILHRLRVLIVIGSIAAPVVVLSRSRMIQEYWRQANPVQEAERLIAQGKLDAASVPVLEQASQQKPHRVDYLRALAKACAGSDPARARRCYEQIDQLGATTDEDVAARALLMAHLESFADAEALLDGARAHHASSLTLLRTKLAVKFLSGDISGVSSAVDDLCRATPDDPSTALEIAAACEREGAAPAVVAQAEQHVISILSRWNTEGKGAALDLPLQALLELPLQDPASRAAARLLLTGLRAPSAAQSLAACALAEPASFSAKAQAQLRSDYVKICRQRGGISAVEKDRAADFLQHQGDHTLVLELIPAPESFTDRALFQRRLSSLLNLGRWREASELISKPQAPTISYCESLCLALKAFNRAPATTSRAADLLVPALREACASGRAEACYTVGCAALDMNLTDIAGEAFACIVRLAPYDAQLMEGMINTARRSGLPVRDLETVISRELGSRIPGPLVAQRLCYLRLLSRNYGNEVHQFIQQQQQSGAADPVYARFLEAMESYQQGDFAGSFERLMPLPNYCWHQGEAAVIIGILCNAGGADQCEPLARNIDPKKLFPEERAMMQPWLLRLSVINKGALEVEPDWLRTAPAVEWLRRKIADR